MLGRESYTKKEQAIKKKKTPNKKKQHQKKREDWGFWPQKIFWSD